MKRDKLELLIIIIVVSFVCYSLLKLTYNDGMKNCAEAGNSQEYCHNELVK